MRLALLYTMEVNVCLDDETMSRSSEATTRNARCRIPIASTATAINRMRIATMPPIRAGRIAGIPTASRNASARGAARIGVATRGHGIAAMTTTAATKPVTATATTAIAGTTAGMTAAITAISIATVTATAGIAGNTAIAIATSDGARGDDIERLPVAGFRLPPVTGNW